VLWSSSGKLPVRRSSAADDGAASTRVPHSLVDASGADQGEAYYAILIEPGDIIWAGDRRLLRIGA
jgi:hypothetical protein